MKIIISGNYGAGNIGDEMILNGLILSLKSINSKVEITVLSADPKETEKMHNVRAVHKFPAGIKSFANYILKTGKETKKAVKNCDYFILGGGGLFSNLTFRANTIWGIQAEKAISYNKKLLQLGQSISPIENKVVRRMIKTIFTHSEIISVRDEASKERLEGWGISNEIIFVPDYAFRIPKPKEFKREKKIIICLREISTIDSKFKNDISTFLKDQIQKGYQLKFINFKNGEGFDLKLHKEIVKELPDNSYEIITPVSITELFEHFSKSELVLGMRLHSVLSAIKTQTPFIAISYSNKVIDLLKTATLEKFSIEQTKISTKELQNKMNEIEANKDEITEKLKIISNNYLEEHLKFEEKLKKYFQHV